MDLNRQEAVALLFLSGALLVGTSVAVLDHFNGPVFEDFHVIPNAVAVPAQPDDPVASGPVSINQADVERLRTLPHIGPKTATAIVEYRRANGPFQSIDALAQVRGIGSATVERLRPLVTIE